MASTYRLLRQDPQRVVLFPIRFNALSQRYKIVKNLSWTTEDIDLSEDCTNWTDVLTDDERALLSSILAFFACSDAIFGENLALQFYSEVQAPDARSSYGFQLMMENVHAGAYTRLVQELIDDEDKVQRLFHSMETIPTVTDKAAWCLKWFDRATHSFAVRVIAFAVVEALFFSSSFAAIFWVRTRGVLPGVCHSNELIMQDECQHVDFACELYRLLADEVSVGVAHSIVREAVVLEKAFFRGALPKALPGLNATLMFQYIEYVADLLLERLGFPVLYYETNPFPFMETTATPGRASIFRRSALDYLETAVGHGALSGDGWF